MLYVESILEYASNLLLKYWHSKYYETMAFSAVVRDTESDYCETLEFCDFLDLVKDDKVYGCTQSFNSDQVNSLFKGYAYTVRAYRPEWIRYDKAILNQTLIPRNIKSLKILGARISDKNWRFLEPGINNTLMSHNDVPVCVSEYIANIAESKAFADDLSYVDCYYMYYGNIRYTLDSAEKGLLGKLRLMSEVCE